MAIRNDFPFQPNEEQLLWDYLKNKLLGRPLPCNAIREADVYGQHPRELAAHHPMSNDSNEWFFFTRRDPVSVSVPRPGRWKQNGGPKFLRCVRELGDLSAFRFSFRYMESHETSGKEKETDWCMLEYKIEQGEERGQAIPRHQMERWVLCKLNWTPRAHQIPPPIRSAAAAWPPQSNMNRVGNMATPNDFSFRPNDEQLLCDYVKNKLLGRPLPCNAIREADVYRHHPGELAARHPEANNSPEWFFFTRQDSFSVSVSRTVGRGRWAHTGRLKSLRCVCELGDVFGFRRTLRFMESLEPSGKEEMTIWRMWEYTIKDVQEGGQAIPLHQMEGWALCKLYIRQNPPAIRSATPASAPLASTSTVGNVGVPEELSVAEFVPNLDAVLEKIHNEGDGEHQDT